MDREKEEAERAARNGASKPYRFNNFDNFKLLGFKVQKVLQWCAYVCVCFYKLYNKCI